MTSESSSRRPLGVLSLTVFIDLLGFGIVIPLLPLYAKRLSATPGQVGMLLASYSAAQLLFAPLWGRLSDRIGRRPVMLVSILGSIVAYVIYASAESLALLFVARTFAGVCGANLATAQAYIADVTTDKNRARGMAIIGAAFALGFVLGPALAGFTSAHFGEHAPFWVAAALAALNLLSAAVFLPEPRAAAERTAAAKPRLSALPKALALPHMAALLVLTFTVTFAFANLEGTFSLWLADPPFSYDARDVGYVFTYIGVILSLVQGGLVGRMTKRRGEVRMVVMGTALLALGMLFLPAARSLAVLLVALVPITSGNGFAMPTLSALVSKVAPRERQGELLGVAQSMSSLARVVGPWFGGLVFERFGKSAPYYAGGAVMAASCLLAAAALRSLVLRAQPAPEPEPPR
jgi:multidrug resistance protein